ncbi:hypothetical protein [Cylindrospermopsis raciborskii]|jgi:excinuclease UvrABC nuclease subunit|uniref:GIY-YIG domain-containing protein n=2 Tax=Cylindrospermopsis raciborskii TaxID=77022 RepID=A0A853MGW1_9CYAN|nr:hypothetical protein [Cylindrospermopsis raciborskii]OBU74792.1 hypothetical protein A9P98_17630 [Cylindrospermopsis raciborskii CS-505]OBU76378.1 hypothetical protein A9P98_08655 [Cylindrospermopsis raciborskii CS-505]
MQNSPYMDKLPYQLRRLLPNTSGVYYVYKDYDLLYVGSSSNIRKRFMKGHNYQNKFIEAGANLISCVVCENYAELELQEILRLKPKMNRYGSHWFKRYTPHSIFEGSWWRQLELPYNLYV